MARRPPKLNSKNPFSRRGKLPTPRRRTRAPVLNREAVRELIAAIPKANWKKRHLLKRQLQLKGIGIKELKAAGIPLRTIAGMDYKVGEFVGMGYSFDDLVSSGFSPAEAYGVVTGRFPPVKK